MYSCRECERPINQGTEICPYCEADLTLPAEGTESATDGKRNLAGVLIRLALVAAALWAFVWFSVPRESGDPVARAEAQAVAVAQDISGALVRYAEAQGGSFPESLEVLGDGARLSAQQALREGYSLHYTPGPLDERGRVQSFTLEVRPSRYGYRSYYTDQTGVVRFTQEQRPATASDPPVS